VTSTWRPASLLDTAARLSVIGIALLYAVGAFLLIIRFRHAGVSGVETLALVPLDQILKSGIVAIVTAAAAVGFVVGLPFALQRDRVDARLRRKFDVALPKVRERVDSMQEAGEALMSARHERLAEFSSRIATFKEQGDPDDAEVDALAAEVEAFEKETHATQADFDQSVREIEAEIEPLEDLRRFFSRSGWFLALPYAVILVGTLFLNPWPFFVASAITVGAAIFLARRRVSYPATTLTVVTATLFVGASLVDQAIAPQPFPVAKVQTTSGNVGGRLVVQTDATWTLIAGQNALRSIPMAQIRSAQLRQPKMGIGSFSFSGDTSSVLRGS
jgi:hypothetical protein